MGTVEDIGFAVHSHPHPGSDTDDDPNGSFSTMPIENFAPKDKSLFHVTLNLKRDTTPAQMRTLLESVTKLLKDNAKVETGGLPVRFVGIGSYSLDIEIFVYVLTVDGDEFMRIQQELLLTIMDAVEQRELPWPFPRRPASIILLIPRRRQALTVRARLYNRPPRAVINSGLNRYDLDGLLQTLQRIAPRRGRNSCAMYPVYPKSAIV